MTARLVGEPTRPLALIRNGSDEATIRRSGSQSGVRDTAACQPVGTRSVNPVVEIVRPDVPEAAVADPARTRRHTSAALRRAANYGTTLKERPTASASVTRSLEARSPTITFTWYAMRRITTSAAAPRPPKHSKLGLRTATSFASGA